jgi:uncharacterized membrane protein YoaK (UPF0700 family)
MLSAQAYSFQQKSKLAISLSWISGYTNVIALIACGIMVSHVTGNFTQSTHIVGAAALGHVQASPGVEQVAQTLSAAALMMGVVFCFFVGAVLSGVMTEMARRMGFASKYIVPIAFEMILLLAFGLLLNARTGSNGHAPLAMIAAVAMGLQNATITMVAGSVVRTTHLTGVTTDLGLESIQYLFWYFDRARGRSLARQGRLLAVSRRHPTALRLLLLLSIIGSFVLGAFMGTVVMSEWPMLTVAPPVAFLGFLVFKDWYSPIADVREIDLLSDPELKVGGLVHELLPPEIGIFRMTPAKHNKSRAPNFQRWLDVIPQDHQILILALAPVVQFDENSVIDLEQAIERLEKSHRKLILCGINQRSYAFLAHHRMIDRIGSWNVCVDVEDALVRGLALMEDIAPRPVKQGVLIEEPKLKDSG